MSGASALDRPLVVVGAGGHAVSVAETVLAAGYRLVGFVDEHPTKGLLLGRPIWASIPAEMERARCLLVIAVGDNARREHVTNRFVSASDDDRLPVIAHPSASISTFAELGAGTLVLQGAVVGSRAILGRGCLVNSGAIVEHECQLGDFASLAPGAVLGGQAALGSRSAVSLNAAVKHGVVIGLDSVVGAQSYVGVDLPDRVVAYGVPARVVRSRNPFDPYLA